MIAHVDLDSFFVAVERARNPLLAGRAVVIGGGPASRGLVAAASREARRIGIRPGMPLVQASVRCPDAVFLDGAFDAYLASSFNVDEIVRRESPDIEWTSIDELYVRLPGDGVSALDRIQRGLRSLGLDAACGLARSKVVAYIASQLARPRGIVHVLDGYEAPFLKPLKIEMLPGLDTSVAQRLRAQGIRRLGELARMSAAEVAPLAGRAGPVLARQAAGIDSAAVRRKMLPGTPLEDHQLAEPTADSGILRAAIDEHMAHVARGLRLRGVYARSLTVRVRYAEGRSDSRTRPLPEPSALTEVLQDAATGLLAQLTRPDRPVRAIAVSCSGLIEGPRDPALFSVRR